MNADLPVNTGCNGSNVALVWRLSLVAPASSTCQRAGSKGKLTGKAPSLVDPLQSPASLAPPPAWPSPAHFALWAIVARLMISLGSTGQVNSCSGQKSGILLRCSPS